MEKEQNNKTNEPATAKLPPAPWLGAFPLASDYGRDVPESWLRETAPVVLNLLLADRSTGRNIRWCTDDYAARGEGFGFADEITTDLICGPDPVIRPRVDKREEEQKARVSSKGEVFTPAWVCNAQNNLVDQSWFGSKVGKVPIFSIEKETEWTPTSRGVLSSAFSKGGKTKKDYVKLPRLEMACGEAPYLTSRYDAATGRTIAVSDRIGLFDRKLRIVSDLTGTKSTWLMETKFALQSIYAFDWQGDNVLLARENLLFATLEAFAARWPDVRGVSLSIVEEFASILSWNVFQMDGVKFVVPETCHDVAQTVPELGLGAPPPAPIRCPGCESGDYRLHNGVRPLVVDWTKSDFEPRAVPFHELFPSVAQGGATS